jgi:hypothetical protein
LRNQVIVHIKFGLPGRILLVVKFSGSIAATACPRGFARLFLAKCCGMRFPINQSGLFRQWTVVKIQRLRLTPFAGSVMWHEKATYTHPGVCP